MYHKNPMLTSRVGFGIVASLNEASYLGDSNISTKYVFSQRQGIPVFHRVFWGLMREPGENPGQDSRLLPVMSSAGGGDDTAAVSA